MENSEQTNVLKGVLASGGIAIGKAFLFEEEDFCIVPRKIQKAAVKKEIERFKDAISHVKTDLSNTKEQILKTLGKKHEPLVDAYLLMLEDPILNRDVIRKIQDDNVNAEYSLWSTLEKVTQSFEKIDDEYFRERKNDVQEIGRRIMRNLTGQHRKHISEAPPDSIIIAHSLAPADTMMLKEHKISGFAINVGGRTSHVAIVAQGLEIP
ncbi:MAG: phosphoenolpyruvate--protein phosphotransferase, partial [Proteobacteria bacterium]|nr:phosphoenolpyruvate--protein phosphotransferase [Pseudomonadota bacterium]